MQVFSEQRFPVDISYGISGGPEYSTDIIEMNNGFEQRNINWKRARNRYNAAHGVKTKEQLSKLIAFFRARKGKAIGFRFKDWTDFAAVNMEIAIGDGVTCAFQLTKHYISGDSLESRIITKPVEKTLVVYVAYKLVKEGWHIDYSSGIIKFDQPPSLNAVITASFEFDVPVRFDTDKLSASIDNYGVYSWQDIPLLEVLQ
jgi:uncharacterized protein (TIGR02217 family)